MKHAIETAKLVDEALEATEFPETAHIPTRETSATQETGLTPELYDWLGNQLHDDIEDSLPCGGGASVGTSAYFWREREDSIMVPFAPVAVEVALKEELFKP